MKMSKLMVAFSACGLLALLAACGGSSTNDAAGTLVEAKQETVAVPEASADTAATVDAAKAAEAAAAAGAEGDAATAAKANGKNGQLGNGIRSCDSALPC